MKIKKEPVAILAAVGAIITALTALGILSPELGGVIGTVVVAIGGLFVRGKVTPMSNVQTQVQRLSTEKVAEAAIETAWRLDDVKTGISGVVTDHGRDTVVDVVQEITNAPRTDASGLVASILGNKRRRA